MTVAEVRTYNARRGRLRPGRLDVLARLAPQYEFRPQEPTAPTVLEIGSGMGEATAAMAAADPARRYVAVEVHTAGVANLLALVQAQGLTNVRVIRGDAIEVLRGRFAPASLDAVHAFFPDPWPKARHHKRRLIQPSHVDLITDRLRPGGVLHCATDDTAYAETMLAVLSAQPGLRNTGGHGFTEKPSHRPVTKYERRGLAAGRSSVDLIFQKVAP